ncbi:MAG: hypothetical protein Q7T82_08215 [Armatimonadota bacterium]|nr:hypothetical protein [Armatimonadota bacterium]
MAATLTQAASDAGATPIRLGPGPHLLLDDYLIADQTNVKRVVNQPGRLPNPVVTGPEDKCFQPYMTILRDPRTKRFRVWYGIPENQGQSHLAYMESHDGIRWVRPHRVLEDPAFIQFGVSIVDSGPDFPDPSMRYKYGWYGNGGLNVAASPDGLTWKLIADEPVVRHGHDINSLHWDPIRKRYVAIVSFYQEGDGWAGRRRHPWESTSEDLINWKKPWPIIVPDSKDEGETQFYAMSGLTARGDLLIGLLKVLRDDLPADEGGDVRGIGYTCLAWSRDGEHWTRDRDPFLPRNPQPGSWDHAMTWGDCQLLVGDATYIYYGGYARGHKVERFTERQIGLARMPRDRYVSRSAGAEEGLLRTPKVVMDGRVLTLNVNAAGGVVRVQAVGADGKPIKGFTFADCAPIKSDSLAAPVRWKRPFSQITGKPIRLEFSMRNAQLYAIGLVK